MSKMTDYIAELSPSPYYGQSNALCSEKKRVVFTDTALEDHVTLPNLLYLCQLNCYKKTLIT